MDTNKLYELWLEKATADKDLIAELESVKGQEEEVSDGEEGAGGHVFEGVFCYGGFS